MTDGLYILLLLHLLPCCLVAQATGTQRPPITPLRFTEDYRFLADSDARTQPLDRLKYIPLGDEASYISLGADVRFLYERLENPLGAARNFYLLRLMTHADLHLGQRLRLFAQLASGRELGDAALRPIDEDKAFLLNLFVDYRLTGDETNNVSLRLGRFEMNYGRGRLITMREGPNVRHSWEGARLRWTTELWTLDAFGTEYISNQPGYFDNPVLDNPQNIWGVYATRSVQKNTQVDIYYLGYRNRERTFFALAGDERRHTLGARYSNTPTEGWSVDGEAMLQYATVVGAAGARHGWAPGASLDLGYSIPVGKWSVRPGVKSDYWSGDWDSTDRRIQNFNPLYPRQGYYQGAGALWASNFYDIHPSLTFRRGPFTLLTDVTWYWRVSTQDGIYTGGAGIPTIPPGANSEKYLGRQINIDLEYRINPHAYLKVIYSRFRAGGFVEANPNPNEIKIFLDAMVSYRW